MNLTKRPRSKEKKEKKKNRRANKNAGVRPSREQGRRAKSLRDIRSTVTPLIAAEIASN